ncbi:MAG: hypothetical protein AMXMBFR34_43200 [Myxococcaceae bacterium]
MLPGAGRRDSPGMRRVALLLALALLASGCRKKSAPEFYDLESSYSVMVASDGDDAYGTAEMDRVLAALQAIPPDTIEGPKAAALVTTIQAERNRIAQEVAEREKALAAVDRPPDPMPPGPSLFPPPKDEADGGEVDAGLRKPWGGMTIAEFQQLYGACFVAGPKKTLPGQGEGTSFVVKDEPKCRAAFGVTDPSVDTFYVFVKDGLVAQTNERKPVEAPPEKKQPEPPPVEDAGQYLFIPGAPLPEHLRPPR